jgi:hypothetical protein
VCEKYYPVLGKILNSKIIDGKYLSKKLSKNKVVPMEIKLNPSKNLSQPQSKKNFILDTETTMLPLTP